MNNLIDVIEKLKTISLWLITYLGAFMMGAIIFTVFILFLYALFKVFDIICKRFNL